MANFQPFDYGQVVDATNRNALAQAQLATTRQQNEMARQQFSLEQQQQNTDWLRNATDQVLQNPDLLPAMLDVGKQRGIINPSFDTNTITMDQVQQLNQRLKMGVAQPQETYGQPMATSTGELVQFGKTGTARPTGYKIPTQELDFKRKQLELEREKETRQSQKMSAGLEKALIETQDATVNAQRSANEYAVLADDFSRLQTSGGLAATTSETFKRILGTQDDVTEFRRRFNNVRLSEGLRNLPPGPATDRDVQEAFKGVPPENAPPEQVVSFLRGAARLARLDAGYNQFKADYISENRSAAGLNNAWRSTTMSPRLNRKVSNAEIYETAQNRGITPEEVRSMLGIE